jgi:uncharacterized protein (TIGR03435 family)
VLGVTLAGQAPLQFEVASLKPHPANAADRVDVKDLPTGQITFTNFPMRLLVLQAFPVETAPVTIVGLPDWTNTGGWDLNARGKAGATPVERQQMFRALLVERAKLAAHYEYRETPSYDLLRLRPDGTIGPQLKPSSLDCDKPQPESPFPGPGAAVEAYAMSRCNLMIAGDTMYSGGAALSMLIRFISGPAGRTIVDKTGLEGRYAFQLTFARRPASTPDAEPLPSVFTAVREQLGLELRPSVTNAQILVIDHIERPTEN